MGRHALGRGGLTATVATLAVAVAAASVTVLTGSSDPARAAGAQSAAGTTRITLTDPASTQPRGGAAGGRRAAGGEATDERGARRPGWASEHPT
ncbi:hypothetical protein ACFVH9_23195, partial [Streptomyces hirsutus]|uniref:hypothetical protein n=1 Tax=Streptomyces hirsutus TaxID=35620 RepID=UPI003626D360